MQRVNFMETNGTIVYLPTYRKCYNYRMFKKGFCFEGTLQLCHCHLELYLLRFFCRTIVFRSRRADTAILNDVRGNVDLYCAVLARGKNSAIFFNVPNLKKLENNCYQKDMPKI